MKNDFIDKIVKLSDEMFAEQKKLDDSKLQHLLKVFGDLNDVGMVNKLKKFGIPKSIIVSENLFELLNNKMGYLCNIIKYDTLSDNSFIFSWVDDPIARPFNPIPNIANRYKYKSY